MEHSTAESVIEKKVQEGKRDVVVQANKQRKMLLFNLSFIIGSVRAYRYSSIVPYEKCTFPIWKPWGTHWASLSRKLRHGSLTFRSLFCLRHISYKGRGKVHFSSFFYSKTVSSQQISHATRCIRIREKNLEAL